jgi:hypothetical protein
MLNDIDFLAIFELKLHPGHTIVNNSINSLDAFSAIHAIHAIYFIYSINFTILTR